MDADPARTAARRGRRIGRLGPGCTCALCGYRNPYALIRVSRTLLEEHHNFGRKRDSESTVTLCRNCHAEVTEDLLREGVPMKRERDPRTRVAYALLAQAVFDRKRADAQERFAQLLLRRITND